MKYGETGDVDCVLVHSPGAEDEFIREGFGVNRRLVMHNDFVIAGPAQDPARIYGVETAVAAMDRIFSLGEKLSSSQRNPDVIFVSRGDKSGTHDKELSLWRRPVASDRRRWYLEAGQGMAQVLNIASEKHAYTLTDRGTFLSVKEMSELVILFESDPALFNPYSIIAINPSVHRHVNYMAAMQLVAWLTSVEGQKLIADYSLGGEQLFFPDAVIEK